MACGDGKLPRRLAVAALILLLTFLSVYPLSMLLYGSLHSTPPGIAGRFNLDGYRDSPDAGRTCSCLLNTVGISLLKTITVAGAGGAVGLDPRANRHAVSRHARSA